MVYKEYIYIYINTYTHKQYIYIWVKTNIMSYYVYHLGKIRFE